MEKYYAVFPFSGSLIPKEKQSYILWVIALGCIETVNLLILENLLIVENLSIYGTLSKTEQGNRDVILKIRNVF